jgi:SnoaL-like protein
MKRTLIAAAAALAFAATAGAATPLTDAQVIQQMRDRAEIEELEWRYARALDSFNPEAYAATYTADGAFGQTKGTEALKKMIVDVKKGRDERAAKGEKITPLYHSSLNHHVEFIDATHAKVHAYYATYSAGEGRDVPARLIAVGRTVDTLVKQNGKWLIQFRDTAPKD